MTIFASTGPVISTRRHSSGFGIGAIFQSPSRMCFVVGEEVGPLAGVETLGALGTRGQQLCAARLERAVQLGDERQRLGREDRVEAGQHRRVDLHAFGQVSGSCVNLHQVEKKISTSDRLAPMRVGSVFSSSSGSPARLTHSVV